MHAAQPQPCRTCGTPTTFVTSTMAPSRQVPDEDWRTTASPTCLACFRDRVIVDRPADEAASFRAQIDPFIRPRAHAEGGDDDPIPVPVRLVSR